MNAKSLAQRFWHDQRGYTMVELITIMSIIGVLSALMVVNTKVGDKRQQLRDAAATVVTAARSAESLASGSAVVDSGGTPTSRKAYGICLATQGASGAPPTACSSPTAPATWNSVVVYGRKGVDTDSFPGNVDIIKHYDLPPGIVIKSSRAVDSANPFIDYFPPSPSMKFRQLQGVSLVDVLPGSSSLYVAISGVSTPCSSLPSPDCLQINVNPGAGAVYVN